MIALNRNLFFALTVFVGLAVSGVIAWQVSATGGLGDNSQRSINAPDQNTGNPASGINSLSGNASSSSSGQDMPHGIYQGVRTAVRFDISPPLRTMVGTPARESREREEFEDLPTGLEQPVGPYQADGSVQSAVGESPNAMPTPIVSFDSTIGCGGCQPPDPNGDVGPNHFVAMGNLQFQIFNKTGTSLFGPANTNTLWAGFGGGCQTQNAGDPVVIYDQLDDRWILTQFTAAAPYLNCVAISQSPDPTGSYFRYAFPVGNGNNFGDYPKYGMWSDALYISTREFAGGSSFVGCGAYAVNRAQLVAGNPAATVISFLAPPGPAYTVGDGLLPTDLDGSALPPAGSPNYFFASEDQGGPYGAPADALGMWKFHADFVTPANSSFTLHEHYPGFYVYLVTPSVAATVLYSTAVDDEQDRPPRLSSKADVSSRLQELRRF